MIVTKIDVILMLSVMVLIVIHIFIILICDANPYC